MKIRFYYKILAATLLSILAFTGNLQAQSEAEFTTKSDLDPTVDYQISDTDEGTFENIDIPPAPVELFSINFDLSPETAIEVGQMRFGCEYRASGCFLKGTNLFQIRQSKGRLSTVVFFCESFDGCSFSNDEVIEALVAQKSLNFNGTCTMTELGAKVCVEYRNITMYRKKFRVPELNFD